MKPRDPKARSIAALQAALDRQGDERARSVARGPEPWPGDLYMLAETAGLPVEWLVVERTRDHCRLVAADTNPALGSTYVPVPADMEGGPLSLRCAVSVQVGLDTLRRGERTGTVEPEILESVRHRLEELAAGSLEAAPDPELEDWHAEVLAPARVALLPSRLEEPKPPPRRIGRYAALAAILLLLAALGGLSALTWQFHRRELQARSEIGRLMQERQALEKEHQRQLAALREAQEAQTRAQRPPAPPPPAPALLRPLVNLAYTTFYPGETRGTEEEIAIPGGATHLLLLFYVGDWKPCNEYELEIKRRGAPAAALTTRGLRPLPGQEVSVAIPRTQLPDGSYQFRLRGMCEGERRELGAYEARLKENSR